ncbi:MAG: cytochrome c [Acidobacteriota bacterium]
MKKYAIVFIAGILLVPAAFYLYLRSGYAPVSTSASPLPFERFFARLAMRATMSHELPKADAGPPTEAQLARGAHIYREYCAVCHGLPNEPRTAISKGLYPHPPQFFKPGESTTYNPNLPYRPAKRKVYWKVKNGIRLSGMPSFKGALTEEQIWEVSQFLGNARNLPPKVVAVVEGKPEQPQQAKSPSKSHQQIAADHK